MIEEEIISVQIGKFSNLIGATIWNLREEFLSDEGNCNEKFSSATYYHNPSTTRRPRCVALDLMENCCNRRQVVSEDASVDSQTWSGKVRKHSGVAYSFNNHSDNDSWVELLKSPLHEKSICGLPVWSNSNNFDSFNKGVVGGGQSDGIPDSYLEEVLDRVRYFAEGCDRLTAVQFTTDLNGGFGGLASSVVAGVSEEYGRSVSLPVWAITDSLSARPPVADASLKSAVQAVDVPLSYSRMAEYAHVFVPVEARRSVSAAFPGMVVGEHSAAKIVAMALEASSSFHISTPWPSQTERSSVASWVADVTCGGRHPVCMVEAHLHNVRSGADDSDLAAEVREAFGRFDCFSPDDDRRQPRGALSCAHASNAPLLSLNPFTHSYSAAVHGAFSAPTPAVTGFSQFSQYHRPYSNAISVRGVGGTSGFDEDLFARCLDSPYLVSSVTARATPVLVEHGWLNLEGDAAAASTEDEEGGDQGLHGVQAIAAVGSSAVVGTHLATVAAAWVSGSRACAVQLDKSGATTAEERAEITEALLALQQRHDRS